MAINTANARDRAEDLLQNLQTKARDWIEAEEGLVQTIGDLVEEKGLSPAETRHRLEDLVGRWKANKLWEPLSSKDKVSALGDYRDEIERRVEDTAARVVDSLPVASRNDLDALRRQIDRANRALEGLSRRVEALELGA